MLEGVEWLVCLRGVMAEPSSAVHHACHTCWGAFDAELHRQRCESVACSAGADKQPHAWGHGRSHGEVTQPNHLLAQNPKQPTGSGLGRAWRKGEPASWAWGGGCCWGGSVAAMAAKSDCALALPFIRPGVGLQGHVRLLGPQVGDCVVACL